MLVRDNSEVRNNQTLALTNRGLTSRPKRMQTEKHLIINQCTKIGAHGFSQRIRENRHRVRRPLRVARRRVLAGKSTGGECMDRRSNCRMLSTYAATVSVGIVAKR